MGVEFFLGLLGPLFQRVQKSEGRLTVGPVVREVHVFEAVLRVFFRVLGKVGQAAAPTPTSPPESAATPGLSELSDVKTLVFAGGGFFPLVVGNPKQTFPAFEVLGLDGGHIRFFVRGIGPAALGRRLVEAISRRRSGFPLAGVGSGVFFFGAGGTLNGHLFKIEDTLAPVRVALHQGIGLAHFSC